MGHVSLNCYECVIFGQSRKRTHNYEDQNISQVNRLTLHQLSSMVSKENFLDKLACTLSCILKKVIPLVQDRACDY